MRLVRPGAAFLRRLELGVIAGLACLYWVGFPLESPINGIDELFDQDTAHILQALGDGRRYPWNPQHHILYHQFVETAYHVVARSPVEFEFTYGFLKLVSALLGLGFLLAFRLLLIRMEMSPGRRILLLALAGISIAAWAGFTLIETYALALPFLMLYLATLHRMLRLGHAPLADRLVLIGALVGCALARIELAGLTLATAAAALVIPGFARLRRPLLASAATAGVLAGLLTITLVSGYLDVSWKRAVSRIMTRQERGTVEGVLMRRQNLAPGQLLRVARAGAVYGFVMPVGGPPRVMDIGHQARVRYFGEPLHNMLARPLSAIALAAALGLLGLTVARTWPVLRRGDPFVLLVISLWIGGWLAYTWYNPHDPYLWITPLFVLTIAMVAEVSRDAGRTTLGALAAVTVLIGLHNLEAFWLAFQ